MEIEYVYADHGVTVTLTSRDGGLVDTMTDVDTKCLQQWLYLAISCFVNARAIGLAGKESSNELEG